MIIDRRDFLRILGFGGAVVVLGAGNVGCDRQGFK